MRNEKRQAGTKHDQPCLKYDLKRIAEVSESPALSERISAVNWLASQGEESKLEVLKKHSEILKHKREPGWPITPELSYGALVLAAKIIRRIDESLAQKRALSVAEANEIALKRAVGFIKPPRKKGAAKFNQIRSQFFGVIQNLRNEHRYSWSEVAAYLQKYHRFVASRAYVQQSYTQIINEMETTHAETEK